MIEIKNLQVVYNEGTIHEHRALKGIDLTLNEGDFITVIGSNGAGKSTLLGALAGSVSVNEGSILMNDKEITTKKEYERARYIGRLFQDPARGTAPHMTLEENLALADGRGKKKTFLPRYRKERERYKTILKKLNMGLEDRLKQEVGTLSGGQRQALTLLMATMDIPDLLLLDEHTAALDPRTSKRIMEITDELVSTHRITTLMVTHSIEHALKYGNRTLVMNEGKILKVLEKEERSKMSVQDILELYAKEENTLSDTAILG